MTDFEFVTPPEHPRINALFFGPPKTGKTAGACTGPAPVLLLNADVGNSTRFAHLRAQDGAIRELKLPRYERGEARLLNFTNSLLLELEKPGQTLANTIVVDPIGELYRRLLEEQSNLAVRPSLNQYGDVGTHVERWCRSLCEIPEVNVALVCSELLLQDEATGEVRVIPFTGTQRGSPALGNKLMSMVDVVGYTGVRTDDQGKQHYMAQLFPSRGRAGGDRFNCLGPAAEVNIVDWLRRIESHERGIVSTLKHGSVASTGNGETATTRSTRRGAQTSKETS